MRKEYNFEEVTVFAGPAYEVLVPMFEGKVTDATMKELNLQVKLYFSNLVLKTGCRREQP
jgi:hypothetical protein